MTNTRPWRGLLPAGAVVAPQPWFCLPTEAGANTRPWCCRLATESGTNIRPNSASAMLISAVGKGPALHCLPGSVELRPECPPRALRHMAVALACLPGSVELELEAPPRALRHMLAVALRCIPRAAVPETLRSNLRNQGEVGGLPK